MDIPERKLDMAYTDTPDEQLAVFAGKPPADARNGRVWEFFTTRPPSPECKTLDAWKQRRAELLLNLHQKVFRAMPDELHNLHLQAGSLTSDETVPVRVLLNMPAKKSPRNPVVLYVASDGDDPVYINQLFRGIDVPNSYLRAAVYPRGIGEVGWDKTFWKATLRNAMQVGETVDSMRLTDVRAAIEALQARGDVDPERITVVGKGVSGALALYAAIFNSRVQHVVMIEPPATHADGPIFLNVLRYTDLPEAAALFAPRHLTFFGHMPQPFEYTKHVWELYGQEEKLESSVRFNW
jgi:hypothetical protein